MASFDAERLGRSAPLSTSALFRTSLIALEAQIAPTLKLAFDMLAWRGKKLPIVKNTSSRRGNKTNE